MSLFVSSRSTCMRVPVFDIGTPSMPAWREACSARTAQSRRHNAWGGGEEHGTFWGHTGNKPDKSEVFCASKRWRRRVLPRFSSCVEPSRVGGPISTIRSFELRSC